MDLLNSCNIYMLLEEILKSIGTDASSK